MSNESNANLSRRQFITGAAATVAGLTVAPGVFLLKPAGAASGNGNGEKPRWGLLIDTNKCADGCTACVRACHEENGVRSLGRPATDAQWIRKVNLTDQATGHQHSLPVMCQHCEHPPCVDVCPTKASFIRPDGIVLVDKHTCIGCRYCMMACPYKARSFIHEPLTDQKPHAPRGKGTVESCTLCVHKVDRGDGTTACVEACNRDGHQAMVFGDLNDPDSEISQRMKQYGSTAIRADLRLNPGVRYQGI
ncbi:sulfate reduction electron transfer complex DsrMKJOP subunit DsrO [Thioalkalivibrio paradoxus]|uniref:4Fe-4S ferredoxin n=1 Tax=Thioalkalivibrio paradoxus ARh 1 TaxID=713585 RepID=W0DPR8_9GAMM|nr:4Fe-4S dicluster domain-containing protein [Thioalkalivibrio paradoxus]AHE98860.1 4Fe-4S ferredoxin [Thioalkalivibrio paradoxus ARh 1]